MAQKKQLVPIAKGVDHLPQALQHDKQVLHLSRHSRSGLDAMFGE
jgi:hypothetical protein